MAMRDTTHINTFKVGLEIYVFVIETINHISDILACNGAICHIVSEGRRKRSEDRVSERVKRVVSTDVVRLRVCAYLIFEASGIDLEVVIWVTPTTEPGRRIVPEGRIVDVLMVCTEAMDYRNQFRERGVHRG